MKRAQVIHINKNHEFYKECDRLCFLSKNLYNQALYRVKKEFANSGKYLNYYAIQREISSEKQADYVTLPRKVSCHTLIQLDENYKAYFRAIKSFQKNPTYFTSMPKPPNFLHKTDGRYVVCFPNQALSRVSLRNGYVKLSGTNINIQCKETNIREVTIAPKSGFYKISIIYEYPDPPPVVSDNFAGIDLGVNNLSAVVINNNESFIINGRPLKSINQYYNKKQAQLQSKLPKNRHSSNKIKKLTNKRNNKIKDYLHKASRKVVNELRQSNVSKVVIGRNKNQKQEINIGGKNNQNFVSIPHADYIYMLKYKLAAEGIECIVREESYTSKCSFLDNETVRKHDTYLGKRIKRGLFRSSQNLLINSDINGAANILKKEIPNAFANGIEGIRVFPRKLSF